MTANCANIISNLKKGCQEIPLQVKGFRNSGKLSKVLASYKTNSFFQKVYMVSTRSGKSWNFLEGQGKPGKLEIIWKNSVKSQGRNFLLMQFFNFNKNFYLVWCLKPECH